MVIDHFLTPTAELADIFLPAGSWLEQNHVADNWKRHGYVFARQKCVEIGEAWQDHKIFHGARQTNGAGMVPHGRGCPGLPAGTLGTDLGTIQGERVPARRNGLPQIQRERFFHAHRKLESVSTILEKWGRDPLPKYVEIPESPYSTPEVAKKYPYIFNSGLRTMTFFHTAGRMIPWLREIRPDPIARSILRPPKNTASRMDNGSR